MAYDLTDMDRDCNLFLTVSNTVRFESGLFNN